MDFESAGPDETICVDTGTFSFNEACPSEMVHPHAYGLNPPLHQASEPPVLAEPSQPDNRAELECKVHLKCPEPTSLDALLASKRRTHTRSDRSEQLKLSQFLTLRRQTSRLRDCPRPEPVPSPNPSLLDSRPVVPLQPQRQETQSDSSMDLTDSLRVMSSLTILQNPVHSRLRQLNMELVEVESLGVSEKAREPDLLLGPASCAHIYKLIKLPRQEEHVATALKAASSSCQHQLLVFEQFNAASNRVINLTPPLQRSIERLQSLLQDLTSDLQVVFASSLSHVASLVRSYAMECTSHVKDSAGSAWSISDEITPEMVWLLQCPSVNLFAAQCILAQHPLQVLAGEQKLQSPPSGFLLIKASHSRSLSSGMPSEKRAALLEGFVSPAHTASVFELLFYIDIFSEA